MNQQEELEALRASESIKHENLQELARTIQECDLAITAMDDELFDDLWSKAVSLAKGVAQ